ncbi:FixH family protein [Curvibacter gracilis]|uniref:FixH family protein n=1 Tax=Curvibacter gracilis TaxID=230310 RepID=UPI0004AD13B1|nr:FixH family protein [Curvibacter gracilis]
MNSSISSKSPVAEVTPRPWWTHGHVWMIISGPAIVVVAGFVTLWLAIRTPDPVIEADYYKRGVEINRTLPDVDPKAMMPALQGRNHAATPTQDIPEPKR